MHREPVRIVMRAIRHRHPNPTITQRCSHFAVTSALAMCDGDPPAAIELAIGPARVPGVSRSRRLRRPWSGPSIWRATANRRQRLGRWTLRGAFACGLSALTIAASACLVSTRDEPIGGQWFIRWETSNLPEAGGRHPYLHRGNHRQNRRVANNTYEWRYLGDECVIYNAHDNGIHAMAVCGDGTPVEFPRGPNATWRDPDTSIDAFKGDPMNVNGTLLTVEDVKLRAGFTPSSK
jgi:hypothetical protein